MMNTMGFSIPERSSFPKMITRSSKIAKRAIQIIAISGVPGVGKSLVAATLAKLLDAKFISITSLVKSGKIPYTWDKERRTKIISVGDTQRAIDRITNAKARAIRNTIHDHIRNPIFIVEGHLAHVLKVGKIFVLRCNPMVLRKRLTKRRWSTSKIEENIQVELLDIITAEAMCRKGKIYEIDTTHKTPKQTAITVSRILKSAAYGNKFRPGKIKWLKSKQIRI